MLKASGALVWGGQDVLQATPPLCSPPGTAVLLHSLQGFCLGLPDEACALVPGVHAGTAATCRNPRQRVVQHLRAAGGGR